MECKGCKYWKDTDPPETKRHIGYCRFNPPVVLSDGDTQWPLTFSDDFCSEFVTHKPWAV